MSNNTPEFKNGLQLGFTLAEVMILLIFLLFILFISLFYAKNEEVEKAHKQVDEYVIRLANTESLLKEVLALSAQHQGEALDSYFQELVLGKTLKEKNAELESTLVELQNQQEDITKVYTLTETQNSFELLEKIQDMQKSTQSCHEKLQELFAATQTDSISSLQNTVLELQKSLAVSQKVMDQIQIQGKTATMEDFQELSAFKEELKELQLDMNTLRSFTQENKKLLTENKNLYGQVRYLETRKGAGKPACWANAETGKPEYIFDMTIHSGGISVSNNAIAHRLDEQEQLPLHNATYGKMLNSSTFYGQFRPIFDFSVKNECRFYVRIHDRTGANEKTTYKKLMNTITSFFYYFPVN